MCSVSTVKIYTIQMYEINKLHCFVHYTYIFQCNYIKIRIVDPIKQEWKTFCYFDVATEF